MMDVAVVFLMVWGDFLLMVGNLKRETQASKQTLRDINKSGK